MSRRDMLDWAGEAAPTGTRLARFPFAPNCANDEKSRQIKMLERILIAKVYQLLRKFALMTRCG